jgi:hypothetical protein
MSLVSRSIMLLVPFWHLWDVTQTRPAWQKPWWGKDCSVVADATVGNKVNWSNRSMNFKGWQLSLSANFQSERLESVKSKLISQHAHLTLKLPMFCHFEPCISLFETLLIPFVIWGCLKRRATLPRLQDTSPPHFGGAGKYLNDPQCTMIKNDNLII